MRLKLRKVLTTALIIIIASASLLVFALQGRSKKLGKLFDKRTQLDDRSILESIGSIRGKAQDTRGVVKMNLKAFNDSRTLHNYQRAMKMRLKSLNDSQICALDINLDKKQDRPATDRKFVVIMATFRSGSSFLGSLFESSQQVMYFYEPLKGVIESSRSLELSTLQDSIFNVLHSMASCSFSSSLARQLIDNISSSVYFPRRSSQVFISPPLCSTWCTRHWLCPPLHYQDVSHVCQSKQAIVAKTIRLANISVLQQFVESSRSSLPIHVLHLIRDPRSIIMSRLNVKSLGALYHFPSDFRNYSKYNNISEWTIQEAESLCSDMRYSIMILRMHSSSFRRYTRLRYETLIANPYQTIQRLYKKYGLQLTPAVIQRIVSNTRIPSNSSEHRDLFSVKRNLWESKQVWKRLMDDPGHKKYIRIVEAICKEVIQFYGYNSNSFSTQT